MEGDPRRDAGWDLRHVRWAGSGGGRRRERSLPAPVPWSCACESASETLDSLAAHVLARSGLSGGSYRVRPLHRRLPACLRALRVSSRAQAMELLHMRPDCLGTALDALLIGVSEFLRDPPVFRRLNERLGRLTHRPLRVWSAACGCGAELASVAMLLDQLGALDGAVLLGTDCRPAAIRQAAAGLYPEHMLVNVPPGWRARYFQCERSQYRLRLPVTPTWQRHDLLRPPPPGPWDVILCRNVTMYLREESAAAVWNHLHAELRPGGFLVTGRAEKPPPGRFAWSSVCLYRRRT